MEKLLLVFNYQINNQIEFDQIISKFEKNDYTIHIFNGLNPSEISLEILPAVIEDLGGRNGKRIAVLSNIKELIVPWFRCYNSLVDDYIFFTDEQTNFNNIYKIFPDPDFCLALLSLSGIGNENIQGKLYSNINPVDHSHLFIWLFNNNNFRYFESIDNFPYITGYKKQRISKNYIFRGKKYYFDNDSGYEPNTLNIQTQESPKINIDSNLIVMLNNHTFFIPFLVIEIVNKYLPDGRIFLGNYIQHLQGMKNNLTQWISDQLINYVDKHQNSLDFLRKISLLSFVAGIYPGYQDILKRIMNTLLEDHKYVDFHYPILNSCFFYISKLKILEYDGYSVDKRNVFQKVVLYFNEYPVIKDIKYPEVFNIESFAIKTDQLLSEKHAPTKAVLDYAMAIKKLKPNAKVKIFVEDNLVYLNQETIASPYIFSSNRSSDCKHIHSKYLQGMEVDIYYSNVTLSKAERTSQLIKAINDFSPEVILEIGAFPSIAGYFLFPHYPIIFMSLGSLNFTNPADVYLHMVPEPLLIENRKYNLIDENSICKFKYGIVLNSSDIKRSRAEFGIEDNDFVMVSVGNRLDAEIDELFMDSICGLLQRNPRMKWVVVGKADLPYLKLKYCNLLERQIIKITYENDLSSFYRLCDIYINPIRIGGGYSIAIAMNEGLPIILLYRPEDGEAFVEVEHCVQGDMTDYVNEIKKHFEDPEYRSRKGLIMKKRIKQFSMEESIADLLNYFEMAKTKYRARKKESD